MEFLAATKDGIFIYDALSATKNGDEEGQGDWKKGKGTDGTSVQVIASVPSPQNAFGHCWSDDGEMLASVCDEGLRIYDANQGYKSILELAKVAPDVGGRTGGVRNMMFSPSRTFLVSYEKWDPQFLENVHVWALTGKRVGERLFSCQLKGYTSGALPVRIIKWTPDEAVAVQLIPGTGLVLRNPDFSEGNEPKVIPEVNASNFELSPMTAKGCYAALYTPESATGMVGKISVYSLSEPDKKATFEALLPAKVKDCKIEWNFDGSAILAMVNSDVDETGCSYFGTTYLYWFKPESKVPSQIYGSKDGQVQDFSWSPTTNEFAVIIGFQPANVVLHDGKTGKQAQELGKSRRNTLKWNPFGRFIAVGGFGTLAGDLDFFDRSKDETVSSLRAPLTVACSFGPDGKHFLSATLAPRMNEGNQISMYRYTGELLFRMDYVPDVVEARHEDTGAGARTKTQALLYAASWRPGGGDRKWEDRPATPPRAGVRRTKGLSDNSESTNAPVAAYRPRGAEGGSSVAAMMRGEIPAPSAEGWGNDPKAPTLAPMEEWEIKKLQKQAQKDMDEKEKQEKEKLVQARKDMEKEEKNEKKKLKELKEKLAELDALKEKDWDELTEEDEEQLEGEVEIRAEILELEKRVGSS